MPHPGSKSFPQVSTGWPDGVFHVNCRFCATPAAALPFEGVTENGDAAVTVSAMMVPALADPPVPFTVNEYGPGATDEATLIVTTELLVAGLLPNVPVFPAGQPEAASVTPELNPFTGTMVTVELPVPPAAAEAAVALRLKPGWAPDTDRKSVV